MSKPFLPQLYRDTFYRFKVDGVIASWRDAARRPPVIAVVETWWDKYRSPLTEIERERDEAAGRLDGFLRQLGYVA